jgi:putative FmdB family regulatory protein
MPIYEYKCKKCGKKFETRVGFFQNKKSIKCPDCGDTDPEKMLSSFSTDKANEASCAPKSFG